MWFVTWLDNLAFKIIAHARDEVNVLSLEMLDCVVFQMEINLIKRIIVKKSKEMK